MFPAPKNPKIPIRHAGHVAVATIPASIPDIPPRVVFPICVFALFLNEKTCKVIKRLKRAASTIIKKKSNQRIKVSWRRILFSTIAKTGNKRKNPKNNTVKL